MWSGCPFEIFWLSLEFGPHLSQQALTLALNPVRTGENQATLSRFMQYSCKRIGDAVATLFLSS